MQGFMNKKGFYTFIVVALIGIGMWAVIFSMIDEGAASGSANGIKNKPEVSPDMAEETDETASETKEVNAQAGQPANWGLAFTEEGKAPIGNATAEYLRQFDAYYIDEKASKEGSKAQDKKGKEDKAASKNIYLTFDAGYENGYTESILDVLKEEQVPAVFFLVGDYIESNPELVRRMVEDGHTVGNHTMTHLDMSAIESEEAFRREIEGLEKLFTKITDHDMKKFYRPPQGKYSEANLKMAKELGYNTIFWSLAYVDWYVDKQPSREDALNTLNSRVHPGAIVLLHSTSKTNAEILKELIQGWKKEGYKFCDIENLTKAKIS